MPTSPPSRTRRAVAPRWLGLALLVLLLAGCQVQVDAGIALQPDDTAVVDLDLGIRFTEDLPPELTGGQDPADAISAEDARAGIEESAASCGFDASLASVEPLETDDGFLGVSVLLDGIPIEAVNCFFSEDSETPFFSDFEIVRDGDEYVFTASVEDLSQGLAESLGGDLGGGLGGQKRVVAQADPPVAATPPDAAPTDLPTDLELDGQGEDLEAFGEAFGEALSNPEDIFDITIRVTFPGEVVESNATTVDASTATWELSGTQATLMARGEASEGGGLGDLLPLLLAGLAVLIGVALIVFLVMRSRRGRTAQPPGGVAPGAPGYAPGGPPGAPPAGVPQWGQQPGQQADPGQAPPPAQPQWSGQPGPAPHQPAPPQPASPQPGQPQSWQPQPPEWGNQPGVPGQQPTAPGEQPGAVGGDSRPPDQPPASPGGGVNPDATRTFRPEDLLPPRDEDR